MTDEYYECLICTFATSSARSADTHADDKDHEVELTWTEDEDEDY